MSRKTIAITFLSVALAIRLTIFSLNVVLLRHINDFFAISTNILPWDFGELANLRLLGPIFCVVTYGILSIQSTMQWWKSFQEEPLVVLPESRSIHTSHWLAVFLSIALAAFHVKLAEQSTGLLPWLALTYEDKGTTTAIAILCGIEFVIHGKHPLLKWYDLFVGLSLSALWCGINFLAIYPDTNYVLGGYVFWDRNYPTNIIYKHQYEKVVETIAMNAFVLLLLIFPATLMMFLFSKLLAHIRVKVGISTRHRKIHDSGFPHVQGPVVNGHAVGQSAV